MNYSPKERAVVILGGLSLGIAFAVLLWLMVFAAVEASPIGSSRWARGADPAKHVWSALAASLQLVLFSVSLSFPIALVAAVYRVEGSPPRWLRSALDINVAVLAAVPSVLWGVFGAIVWVRVLALGDSLLTGALSLAALMLPIEFIATRDALWRVPVTVREAACALGASQRQVLTGVVVPAAMPGILTGVVLAIARAAGEAAPLLFLANVAYSGFGEPGTSYAVLPVRILTSLLHSDGRQSHVAAAGVLILLVFVVATCGVAVWARARWEAQMAGQ